VVTKFFWPEGGGGELATYLIAKDVLSKYFRVTIISGTKEPAADVLKHCRYVWWHPFTEKYKPIEWLKLIENAGQLARLVKQADIVYIPSHTLLPLAIIAKRIKPDVKVVVHLHNYQPLTYTSVVLAGKRPNMATDLMVERCEHGSSLRAVFAGMGHYINLASRPALHYADKVVCVSRRQHEILTENLPTLKSKAIVVYNPPPQLPNVEKSLDLEPTIHYTGGGSYVKGFHVFMQAALNILKQGNRASFLLTKEFKREHVVLIRKLDDTFKKTFRLLGHLSHDDVLKLYSRSYAVLVPSTWEEPLPYVIFEAMAAGLIPVVTEMTGSKDLVKLVDPSLVVPLDVDAISMKIVEVLSMDIREKETLSRRAKKVAEEWSAKTKESFLRGIAKGLQISEGIRSLPNEMQTR